MPRVPYSVEDREVIIGSGPAAATYAATRRAMGFAPPVVFEQNLAVGGMFAQLLPFKMNSQNWASIQSVASPGPSRVPSTSQVDDLNWIPNSAHQARDYGAYEYPRSTDMRKAIAATLKDCAEVYTAMKGVTFNRYGTVNTPFGESLGRAKRVLFAAGLIPKNDYPKCRAVMSGYDFMRIPPMEFHDKRVALVGSGDTAAQCAEYMLGQGVNAPGTLPVEIHWYGDVNMPKYKSSWAEEYHARFSGLARHFPQAYQYERSVIRPYPARGSVTPLGGTAMVNGQVYDLVIMATGFKTAGSPVFTEDVVRVGDMPVALSNASETDDDVPTVYRIGSCAGLTSPTVNRYSSRFTASQLALYNQLPRVAALAASLD